MWRYGDSNPRPRHCERRALPTELYPRLCGRHVNRIAALFKNDAILVNHSGKTEGRRGDSRQETQGAAVSSPPSLCGRFGKRPSLAGISRWAVWKAPLLGLNHLRSNASVTPEGVWELGQPTLRQTGPSLRASIRRCLRQPGKQPLNPRRSNCGPFPAWSSPSWERTACPPWQAVRSPEKQERAKFLAIIPLSSFS